MSDFLARHDILVVLIGAFANAFVMLLLAALFSGNAPVSFVLGLLTGAAGAIVGLLLARW